MGQDPVLLSRSVIGIADQSYAREEKNGAQYGEYTNAFDMACTLSGMHKSNRRQNEAQNPQYG